MSKNDPTWANDDVPYNYKPVKSYPPWHDEGYVVCSGYLYVITAVNITRLDQLCCAYVFFFIFHNSYIIYNRLYTIEAKSSKIKNKDMLHDDKLNVFF